MGVRVCYSHAKGPVGAIKHITIEGPDSMTTLDWKISQTTIIVRDPVSERVLALLTNPSPTYSCHLHKRPKIPACMVPHFARN